MNILHLNSEPALRGGERQTLSLIKYLNQWGHNCLLTCSQGSAIAQKAKELGIITYEIKFQSEYNIFTLLKLYDIVKQNKIDLIHAHTSRTATYAGLIARLLCGKNVRCVVSRRVQFSTRGNPLRKLKYQCLPHKIIAISEGVKKVLVADGISEAKISVVYSGIEPQRFDVATEPDYLQRQLGIPRGAIIILNIAYLNPSKGLKYLLDAMSILLGSVRNIHLVQVGSGEMKQRLLAHADYLGISRHVTFAGRREDIPQLMHSCDIFVISSEQEGLCTSIMDAMVCAKPVVATKVGGIPEIVKDGETGFLVSPRDAQALADKIRVMLLDDNLRSEMGAKGRELILDSFTAERMARNTLDVYPR